MANTYFRTENGWGYTEDGGPIPEGSVEITEEEYLALENAQQEAADQAAAQALAEAKARWTTVHDDLVAAGVSDRAAVLLAGTVGLNPTPGG